MTWGEDNDKDRSLGETAELEAAKHFALALWAVKRYPHGRTGPDMRVTSHLGRGDRYYVEVRYKAPTRDRLYGLEENKLELWRELDVLYTIKDHEREAWFMAQMRDLGDPVARRSPGSYYKGRMRKDIYNVFWPIAWWIELPWEYE